MLFPSRAEKNPLAARRAERVWFHPVFPALADFFRARKLSIKSALFCLN
jgi:hypothetical protein